MSEANLEKVEKAADRIRDELFSTLRELDRRRHEATDWRAQLAAHREVMIVAGAAVGAGLLGLAGFIAMRVRSRDERRRRAKRRGVERALKHPERLALEKKGQRPLTHELGRKVALVVATTLATQLARGAGQRFLYARKRPA